MVDGIIKYDPDFPKSGLQRWFWHCESWRAHLRTTSRAHAKAIFFETSLPRREKKRIKQVTYLCLLGVRLETWGGLGLQSRVPDTRSASSGCLQPGARSALLSNKTLATQAPPAPRGDLGTPFQPALAPRFPGWPAEPTLTTCFLTYSSVSYPSSCRSHTDPGPPQFSGGQPTWAKEHKENLDRVLH